MTTNPDMVLALQKGIPITARPFDVIGSELGLTGPEVVEQLKSLLDDGYARRFGAVFDSHKLGYASTLCAIDAADGQIESIAARLIPHPGITHCYERKNKPSLWFTLTTPGDSLSGEINRLQAMLPENPIMNLPAIRRFKISTIFDVKTGRSAVPLEQGRSNNSSPVSLSDDDKALVRTMQETMPIVESPFLAVADELNMGEEQVLAKLADWQDNGIVRRIGLILRHRKVGFSANGMCVWNVPENRIEACGQILADCPEVTHCYHRPSSSAVPFNLYAMVHADSTATAKSMLHQISERAGLPIGKMLISTREFKKSSPVFFCEKAES